MDKGIIFKAGTSLWAVHPKIRKAIWEAKGVLNDAGYRCVVTALWDGIHSENSFHHYGMGVDIRSNEIRTTPQKKEVRDRIQNRLGGEFDVLYESPGTANEHFHIEWEAGRNLRDQWVREVLLGPGSALPTPVEEEKKESFWSRIF